MDLPGKATHQATRAHNERLVLATIYGRGPISRAAVARATALTRTTVSDVVTDLIDADLVRETGKGRSTGGKAPMLLETPDDARHLLGIDLGEGRFRGAILDLRGRVLLPAEVPLRERRGEDALTSVFRLVEHLMKKSARPLVGIGVGTPGLVDTRTGSVAFSVDLGWRDVPLGRLLGERFGLPVHLANDSHATALAEWAFGAWESANLVAVRVGRGVGAGIVVGGRLLQGDSFGAGEIGHTVAVDGGTRCRCGNRGCLETVASSGAILARIAAALPEGSAAQSIRETAAAFRRGEEPTRSIVLDAGRFLGAALAGLVGTLDIHRIVLVGSATAFGDPWLRTVRESVRERAFPPLAAATQVDVGRLGEDTVLLGASALLLTHELGVFVPAHPGSAHDERKAT